MLIRLDAKLVHFLKGENKPTDAELVTLAQLCQYKQQYRASFLFWKMAIGKNSNVNKYRPDAVFVAMRAATRQGKDNLSDGEDEGSLFRKQSLKWLHEAIDRWTKDPRKDKSLSEWDAFIRSFGQPTPDQLRRDLLSWRRDPLFATVRDKPALAKLPTDERRAWEAFWAEVDKLLKRTE